MAGKNIKGITIEIDGDISSLTQALKKVDNETKNVQTELKQVDRLLKFDPSNVELLSQKQKLLGDAVDSTSKRLDALKQAQSEVERQFQSGEIGEEAYRKFQREIIATENKLKAFKSQADAVKVKLDAQVDTSGLDKMKQKLDEVADKAKEVGNKMKDVGSEMTTKLSAPLAAFGGGALLTAGQFDNAAGQIQAALGITADEAESLEDRAKNVWKAGFGESLEEVTNALVRVKQNIKGITDEAELEKVTQDALALAKTFDSDVVEVTRAANNLMTNFGLSSEEAFDKMAKGAQNGLNFSNEMFDNLAEYAPLFADAGYSADEMFKLLEKGSEKGIYNLDYLNDVVKEFGIRLTDGSKGTADSLAVLFQPEGFEDFIGNLATAGKQSEEFKELVKMVGTESATTMVEGLQKGGKTAEDTILAMQKTMGGYGEIVQGLQDGTISTSDAMESIIGKLNEIEDPIERNTLGVQLFGTKWEDLGADVVLSLGGVKGALLDTEGAMKSVTDAQEQTFGQRWDNLVRSSASSLEPVGKILLDFAETWLPKIIGLIESLANWFSGLSPIAQMLTVVFGAIATAIGPVLLIVGQVISTVSTLMPIFTTVFGSIAGAISAPVLAIVAGVTAVIAIAIALWKNWEEISTFLISCWENITSVASTVFGSIGDFFSGVWDGIKSTVETVWTAISDFFNSVWDGISSIFETVLNKISTTIDGYWKSMKDGIKTVWDGITSIIKNVWEVIKNVFAGALLIILDLLSGNWKEAKVHTEQILGNIKEAIFNIWEGIKNVFSGALSAIIGFVKQYWENFKTNTTETFNSIKTFISDTWESIKQKLSDLIGAIVEGIKQKFTDFVTAIKDKMTEVKTNITNVWEEIKTFLASINLFDIGKNIIEGLVNGIASMASAVWDKVTSIVDGIKGAITGALDINSPSKVTEGYGVNVGQGLVIGMDNMINKVSNASTRLSDAVKSAYGSLSSSAVRSSVGSSITNSSSTINNTPTSNVFHVTIDSKNVKEFNDIVKLMQGIPQVSRAF